MSQDPLLFSDFTLSEVNLLPRDGGAHYYPAFISSVDSNKLMEQLLQSLQWQSDQIKMFGKLVTTRRKVAWIGDPRCTYSYSGVKKSPKAWTPEILFVKNQREELAQSEFNSCLLNLYHDGEDGMGWHSDNEKELDASAPIVSLSLGAQRKFAFRHKGDKTTIPLYLENGSALMMRSPTQEFWQHALLKTKRVSSPRINLTFRKIKTDHD